MDTTTLQSTYVYLGWCTSVHAKLACHVSLYACFSHLYWKALAMEFRRKMPLGFEFNFSNLVIIFISFIYQNSGSVANCQPWWKQVKDGEFSHIKISSIFWKSILDGKYVSNKNCKQDHCFLRLACKSPNKTSIFWEGNKAIKERMFFNGWFLPIHK